MSVELIARRYATALADSVGSDYQTSQTELKTFEEIMSGNAALSGMFANPAFDHTSKVKILDNLIEKTKPTAKTANFLRILLENGRLANLADINKSFVGVLSERSGLMTANVTTARDLSAKEQKDLQTNLEKMTGKQITLNYRIDKEIIGGIVTRIGSTVYDSSVKTQLENLKQQLVAG
jgi:F-type H+-transporting ATPase subunit delta